MSIFNIFWPQNLLKLHDGAVQGALKALRNPELCQHRVKPPETQAANKCKLQRGRDPRREMLAKVVSGSFILYRAFN